MILENYPLKSVDTPLRMWRVCVNEDHQPTHNHRHTNFEIATVLSGGGVYSTDNAAYPMQKGDVFVFSSNEYHCISSVNPEGLQILNLQFKPIYLLGKNREGISKEHYNFCFTHSKEFSNRIESENASLLKNELFSIKNELINCDIEYKLAVKSHVNNIMIELLRNHKYFQPVETQNKSHIKNLKNVLLFIDEHFAEKISLSDLAKQCSMSDNHFSFVFKSVFNILPSEYIISKRLEYAVQLLISNPDMNMLDIALQCGFNNSANFNKIFKKYIGTTPSQHRKNSADTIIY